MHQAQEGRSPGTCLAYNERGLHPGAAMRIVKTLLFLVLIILFAFLALAFITHNEGSATVDLLFIAPIELRLATWLILFFVFGVTLGLLASTLMLLGERARRKRTERRMQNTTKLLSGYHS
ncbi:MAG: lipopolysaccharide assembly protein LapA domain-containing protein [Pseudomonadales bacterium]